jgi:hypothetical protein
MPTDRMTTLTHLADLNARLVFKAEPTNRLLDDILDAAMRITRADMGNIQLLNVRTGLLEIAIQQGFEAEFLDFFATVGDHEGACGTAMSNGQRTIVDDVTESPIFARTDAGVVLLRAGVRAVQSTPLRNHADELVGMLSTHYRRVYRPESQDLELLDWLVRLCRRLPLSH